MKGFQLFVSIFSIIWKVPLYFLSHFHNLILTCIVAAFIFGFMHSLLYHVTYDFVPDSNITQELVAVWPKVNDTCTFRNSMQEVDVKVGVSYNASEFAAERRVYEGGWWTPYDCEPLYHAAIIVPYRNRPNQLNDFLYHMHGFLQTQNVSYRIIVMEQVVSKPFNRGKLLNVGFKEALKLEAFQCLIFHDVNLLPQVEANLYACSKNPRHMSPAIDVLRYQLTYDRLLAGVLAMTTKQFLRVNGYSNMYYGRKGEDEDLIMRIKSRGMQVIRFSPMVSKYWWLPPKPLRRLKPVQLDDNALERINSDGISSLDYDIHDIIYKPLYTHVIVDI